MEKKWSSINFLGKSVRSPAFRRKDQLRVHSATPNACGLKAGHRAFYSFRAAQRDRLNSPENVVAAINTLLTQDHIINLENEPARRGAARKQDARQVAPVHPAKFRDPKRE